MTETSYTVRHQLEDGDASETIAVTVDEAVIEKVARAICAAQFPEVSPEYAWNAQFDDGKDEYRAQARAAMQSGLPLLAPGIHAGALRWLASIIVTPKYAGLDQHTLDEVALQAGAWANDISGGVRV